MHTATFLSFVISASAVFAKGTRGASNRAAAASSTTAVNVDFTTYTSGSVASFLSSAGLSISDYSTDSTPQAHTFVPGNVGISNGALTLLVSGGTTNSAEVVFDKTFLYGNITTRAQISTVPGTCAGFFFYKDDNNEQDIELLSSYVTTGYKTIVPPGIELTNQAATVGGTETNSAVGYGFDPTAAFHDYTIVWTPGLTEYYVDGQIKASYTTNVPSVASSFILNNWSSGDPNWSAGPPTADNIVRIQSVTGYYA
ncbi:glycoside hydrolase family 16 protein [Athelia psychrophila]|uniref:Glycoside hydrolase family 16 protein n=1 Tax=Athelia psychrophila TaxID=1759441 RepID=A0A166FVI0_9AGAM|nr:glycoside hydrolase family 16 protein [Fibularhizoctonia sp. CBS 109695]